MTEPKKQQPSKKSSAWKQGVNRPKTNWASKTAVNRRTTGRAKQNKVG
jgi:hypothetical protein